ncbi:MAG: formyltetrahydrofolate deformylase [Chthoniobacterales bacterium]
MEQEILLKLSCRDRVGLLAAVTGFCAGRGLNLLEAHQFTDAEADWFFTRLRLQPVEPYGGVEQLRADLEVFAAGISAEWSLRRRADRRRVALLVSREGHCLADLLWRWRSHDLPMDLAGVIGNHPDLEQAAVREGVPFVHLPITPANRAAAFASIDEQLTAWQVDTAVLARFMQIVPPHLCARWSGRMVNIHHSFLPAFAGAAPYRQAHERGVKLIGATCHYVTADLDAGPIIDQEVARVEHFHSLPDLLRLGQDCERLALFRGLRYHLEERVFVHGKRTVVFRD